MNEIKIDWLSFTYQPNDDDKAAHSSIIDCFLAKFPKFRDILDECVVFAHGNGKYYSNCLGWNDGILFCYDDDSAKNINIGTGQFIDEFEHGFNVSIPSHGLHYISDLFGFDIDENNFISFKPVLEYLYSNDCHVTRLDICYDDYNKTFMPADFIKYHYDGQIKSPCHKFTMCTGGKNGGATFYVGARANKMLRIYDKAAESSGAIDAVRYEIECHHRFAKQVCDTVINGTFNFAWFLEHWFIQLKEKATCASLSVKSERSRLATLPEWESWINTGFANNEQPVITTEKKAVSFENTAYWLRRQCSSAIAKFIHVCGFREFLDMVDNAFLSNKDMKVCEDAIRIYNRDPNIIRDNVDFYHTVIDLSEKMSALSYWDALSLPL